MLCSKPLALQVAILQERSRVQHIVQQYLKLLLVGRWRSFSHVLNCMCDCATHGAEMLARVRTQQIILIDAGSQPESRMPLLACACVPLRVAQCLGLPT